MAGFADGLNAGVNMVLNAYNTKVAAEDRQRRNERQDKQWARDDAQQQAIDDANKAARDAFEAHQSKFKEATQPKATEQLQLTSGAQDPNPLSVSTGQDLAQQPGTLSLQSPQLQPDAIPGASLALSGVGGMPRANLPMQAVTTKAPDYDEREGVLAGLSARRKSLMAANADSKLWMDDWAKESQLRSQIRAERVDGAEKRFLATGDPGEYARIVYPLIDDGYDFVGTREVKGLDGKPAWEFTRRDQVTGKEVTNTMNADQFQRFMMGVRDPAKVAEVEAKALIERIKADEKIRAAGGEEVAKQGTAKVKSQLKLGEISAEGAEARKTVAAKGGQDRLTEREKPLVLSEGATAFGREDTSNGLKLIPIAKGEQKDGKRYSAKDLNQMVIDNYGVTDMANRAMGSDETARIAAAAEIILRKSPSMGANQAIAKAAKDLNLNITPKK